MAGTKFKFSVANLDDVASRALKLVAGITTGVGARSIKDECEKIVSKEYADAFSRGGFPGNKWKSSKGPVSLIRDKLFIESFKGSGLEIVTTNGVASLLIQIASTYKHPRMEVEYVAALRGGIELSKDEHGNTKHSIEMFIGGNAGGITRSGARELFSKFRKIVRVEAKRVGYT